MFMCKKFMYKCFEDECVLGQKGTRIEHKRNWTVWSSHNDLSQSLSGGTLKLEEHSSCVPAGAIGLYPLTLVIILCGLSLGKRPDHGAQWLSSVQRKSHRSERVTGRKARGPQTEEIGCKCQTFLSLLSSRGKQTSRIFFLLYTNLKGGFS